MLFVVSAFGRTSAPMDNRGFTFKLKDLGNGIKLIEEYEEDGTKKKARNYPKKNKEKMRWLGLSSNPVKTEKTGKKPPQ